MGNKNKPYLTIEQQIELLEKRNLKINDKRKFSNFLRVYNYQQLVNGYNDPFFNDFDRSTNFYTDESNSEAIIELFNYDRKISSRILYNIQNIERQFSTFLSRTISEIMCKHGKDDCFILDTEFNLSSIFKKPKNLKDISLYKHIEKIMTHNVDYKFNYLKNYQSYRKMPVWILSLTWSFGDLIKIFECLNENYKYEIIRNFRNIEWNIDEFVELMYSIKRIRNIIAHNNVLYSNEFKLFEAPQMEKFIQKNQINIAINENNKYGIYDFVKIIDKILNNGSFDRKSLEDVLNDITEKLINCSKNIPKISKIWIFNKIRYQKN